MNRRQILAWCAAALIVALVSAAFLRPAREDFGFVDGVFSPYDEIPITDCTGDTHLIRAEAILPNLESNSSEGIAVKFTADSEFVAAFTGDLYRGGELISEHPGGTIEKLVDGEWTHYSGTGSSYAYFLIGGALTYSTARVTPATPAYEDYYFPSTEPGTYRITYNFREATNTMNHVYATGDELYSVSHTVTVPEPSGARYDLITPGFGWFFGEVEGGRSVNLRPLFRVNYGDAPAIIDLTTLTFEKNVGGEWVEAPADPEVDPADALAELQRHPYREVDTVSDDTFELPLGGNLLYADDPTAEYRLTMELVENADGTGERYTLTLNLKFSQEG